MGIINPYCWVDDHPLLYGNNGSLDPWVYKPLLFWLSFPSPMDMSWEIKCHDLDRTNMTPFDPAK